MSLLALALLSSPAHALSCVWGVHSSNVADGTGVPTNAEIVLYHTMDSLETFGVVLEDADGNIVPTTLEDARQYATLSPDSLLPGDTYTIRVSDEAENEFFTIDFTVDAEADTEAPDAPVFVSAEKQDKKGQWGETRAIVAELAPVANASHFEFEIATKGDFSDAHRVSSSWPSGFLGQGLCDNTVPEYDASEDYLLRARSVDLAGNVSDWTMFDGTIRSSGCSSTRAPASLLLGALASLALFRRRRSHPSGR